MYWWDSNSRSNWQKHCRYYDLSAITTWPSWHVDVMRAKLQIYDFLRNDKFPVLHWKFWIKIEITFPRSGCSRYLKACRRPTLWLLSSHFGRMQEHPLRGKDIKHQSSIYLIKINKTWDFLVEPPDFHH